MQLKQTRTILRTACVFGLIVGSELAKAELIDGTVELDGSSPTYSGLTGSGTLKNSSATLSVVTVDASGDATFDGVLTGNIRLVTRGRGVPTL